MAVRMRPRRIRRRPRRLATGVRRQPKLARSYRLGRRSPARRIVPRARPRYRKKAPSISTPRRRQRRPRLRSRRLAPKVRKPRRRRPLPWRYYPYPPWFVVETRWRDGRSPTKPPSWANRPEMRRYSRAAQSALWRRNMLHGVWIDRLMRADERLVTFVNRFYHAPGFHYVVRDYFNGRFKRNIAQMAMRLARRLRDQGRTLRFERSLVFASGGVAVRSVKLISKGIHYILNAWPRIDADTMRQLYRRSTALYGTPQNVRWVFDRTRLRLRKQAIINTVRRALRRSGSNIGMDNGRAWLNAIDRLIIIV